MGGAGVWRGGAVPGGGCRRPRWAEPALGGAGQVLLGELARGVGGRRQRSRSYSIQLFCFALLGWALSVSFPPRLVSPRKSFLGSCHIAVLPPLRGTSTSVSRMTRHVLPVASPGSPTSIHPGSLRAPGLARADPGPAAAPFHFVSAALKICSFSLTASILAT